MGTNIKNKKELLDILDQKTLVCDGAMGTTLQTLGYKGPSDLLNLDPEALKSITEIHLGYLEAGSDIIQTNTLGSSPLKLEQSNQFSELKIINIKAIEAAKNAIELYREKTGSEKVIFIAGDIGPSGELLKPYGDVEYETMVDSFCAQIEILLNHGADFILIETMIDLNEARAAVEAARKITPKTAVACTLSFKENGVTVMGNKAEDFGKVLLETGCNIIGANCSVGSDSMIEITAKIRKANPSAKLLIQPNAGLPKFIDSRTVFSETPEIMAENFKKILEFKPEIIGACCGSTPEHIKKIAELVK